MKGPATQIIGGTEAVRYEYPWMVEILRSDNSFWTCGATLLSCDPLIVVSAAHCFQGTNAVVTGAKLAFGSFNADSQDTGEIRLAISEVINHPQYNSVTQENDIAVIKVSGTLTCEKKKIWPACLPNTNVSKCVTNIRTMITQR